MNIKYVKVSAPEEATITHTSTREVRDSAKEVLLLFEFTAPSHDTERRSTNTLVLSKVDTSCGADQKSRSGDVEGFLT